MTIIYPSTLEKFSYGTPGWNAINSSNLDKINNILNANSAWQLPVIDRDLTAPPGSESDGDRYIVGASATGDWSGQDGKIAHFNTGNDWTFISPFEGMITWLEDEGKAIVYTSSEWTDFVTGGGDTSAIEAFLTEKFISGEWYDSIAFKQLFPSDMTINSQASLTDQAIAVPFWSGWLFQPNRIEMDFVLGPASSEARLWIADDLNFSPNDTLFDSSAFSIEGGGQLGADISGVDLNSWSWLIFQTNNPNVTCRSYEEATSGSRDEDNLRAFGKNSSGTSETGEKNCWRINNTWGTSPSNWQSSLDQTVRIEAPVISLRAP